MNTIFEEIIEAMARGLEEVADLPDPLGTVLAEWQQPNGVTCARPANGISRKLP